MSMEIQISIIVPIYNTPEIFLHNCLNSLHEQNLQDIEFIIINDGSTVPWIDKTVEEICLLDNRFKYYKKQNTGVADTRNKGIEYSQGKYIMFVDSDDILLPNACEYALDSIKSTKADAILFGADLSRSTKEKVRKNLSTKEINELKFSVLASTSIYIRYSIIIDSPWAKIFKSSIIKNNHICFPINLLRSEDAFFCLYYYNLAQSIFIDSHIIYRYEYTPNSLCRSMSDTSVKMLPLILREEEKFISNSISYNYTNAICIRLWNGINESLSSYYFNHDNPKGNYALSKELKKMMSVPITKKYFKLLTFKLIHGRKNTLNFFLLKAKMYYTILLINKLINK